MLTENIFFPIEGIYRELDYKLFLAAMLVEKDKTITMWSLKKNGFMKPILKLPKKI
jgi:hypothetical protein